MQCDDLDPNELYDIDDYQDVKYLKGQHIEYLGQLKKVQFILA